MYTAESNGERGFWHLGEAYNQFMNMQLLHLHVYMYIDGEIRVKYEKGIRI